MLVSGILGFEIALLTLIFFVGVLIRHKWKDAEAKKEEIMRLVAMASQEAAMAEVEATVQYGPVSVVGQYQCAVCYSPTTMRCSQCKLTRYCSGKCQILHWRQGHKDECCPPIATMPFEEESDFDGKSILERQSEINGNNFGVIRSGTKDELEKPLSDDVATDMVGTAVSSNESTNVVNYVDSISCASKSSKKKSGHIDERADFKSQFSKPAPVITNDVKPKIFGNSKPTGSTLAGKLVADATKSDDGEDDSELFKHKEVKSLSSNTPNGRPSSAIGGQSISHPKSAKIEAYNALPAKVGSIPSLPQNVRNGLKTSVRKVVQQFKASKESKPNLLDQGNEIGGKNNIVFPYELFMKLYCFDKVDLRPFGLTNCGNSCYANAVLQCLAYTRPLTTYLLQGLHSKSCRKKGWCFICEFECLIQKAKEGYSPLSPIGILSKIHKIGSHLGHGREEDAHEFLRYAVDTMQSVCLKGAGAEGPVAQETTLVGLTFGGYLRSKIKCMKCFAKSEQYERMMDLTVEIDGDIGTLEEALTQFTATEILDRENKYYCSRCKSYEKARKKLTILEAPNILTIVLKRFRSGNFEKLNKSIQFPEVLNMTPYISGINDNSPLYSLYAVVVHLDIMDTAFSGHYVCYVKNFNGEWFRIDDSTVEPVELERVLLEGAYMLLYAR
ncbi:hypothetical protein ACJW30_02G186500 [Castanea mollissima]